jgi:hypothetical protein
MLMNFQKELTSAEQELQRLRQENQKWVKHFILFYSIIFIFV